MIGELGGNANTDYMSACDAGAVQYSTGYSTVLSGERYRRELHDLEHVEEYPFVPREVEKGYPFLRVNRGGKESDSSPYRSHEATAHTAAIANAGKYDC